VLLGLVQAELDVHEQRIEYYKIQAQLAKARILDRALSRAEEREPDKAERDDSGRKPADTGSEDDKAAKKEDKQDAV
jgi:hypothetical protein